MSTPLRRQRGWVGLIVILLALVIVALLGQTLLRQMGILPGEGPRNPAGVRQPGAAAPIDNTGATPAPTQAIERARSLEKTLQQQAEDFERKLDGK